MLEILLVVAEQKQERPIILALAVLVLEIVKYSTNE
jgi:hypothetical protein